MPARRRGGSSCACVLLSAGLLLATRARGVTVPLYSAARTGAKPLVEMTGEFGNSGGSPLDLGGVFAAVTIGSQEFNVHVDTGSSMLIVPAARSQCPTCAQTQRTSYSPGRSAEIVPCHSAACNMVPPDEEHGASIAVCRVEQPDGFPVCPREDDSDWPPSESPSTGKGICKTDTVQIEEGQTVVACDDHLSAGPGIGCPEILNNYNGAYTCGMDMAAFGLSPNAEHPRNLMSEYCPEECGQCGTEGTRFCRDNDAWTDSSGHGCSHYADGGAAHADCFATHAHLACPVSCNSCGDCCTLDDGCYFFSAYADGSAVTGAKYQDTVTVGGLSASAVIGVYRWVHEEFEVSPEVDGILGLSFATGELGYCNPTCSETVWDSLAAAFPGGLGDVFALCLSGMHTSSPHRGISSWDVGEYDHAKYSGAMHWFRVPETLHDSFGELDRETGQRSRVNTYYLFEGGIQALRLGTQESLIDDGMFCPDGRCTNQTRTADARGYTVLVDSGVSQMMFPLALYNAYANYFISQHGGSFTRTTQQGDELAPITEIFQEGASQETCAGPVAESYDPDSEFETLFLSFSDERGTTRQFTLEPHHYLVKRRQVEGLETLSHGWWLCNGVGLTPQSHLTVENPIVLGTVFMSNHYSVFDRANARIGFAQVQDCTAGLQLADRPCSFSLPPHTQSTNCPRNGVLGAGQGCTLVCEEGYQLTGQSETVAEVACQAGSLTSVVQCVESQSPCAADPCQHDSFCVWLRDTGSEYRCCDDPDDDPYAERNGVAECQCPPGYDSPESQCATLIDNCESFPCQHEGQCANAVDSYTCTCEVGFSGENCEVDIDECAADPCGVNAAPRRGQACTQIPQGGFFCQCETGWSGDDCTMENACDAGTHNCGENAYCTAALEQPGEFTCTCREGFEAAVQNGPCEMIHLCDTTVCQNGAACTDSLGAYSCECRSGFQGDTCEHAVDGCVSAREPCGDFGSCASDWNQPNGYSCTCSDSYSGTNCDVPPAICSRATNPCQNGGACTPAQGDSHYECACSAGWSGDNCDQAVDPCSDAPCGMHGQCVSAEAEPRFACRCTDGYEGPTCSERGGQNVCASSPCQNGGFCQEEQGGYGCYCEDGYDGDNCEIEIDGCACIDDTDTLRGISPITAAMDCALLIQVAQSQAGTVALSAADTAWQEACRSYSLTPFRDPLGRSLADVCALGCGTCNTYPCGHGRCADAVDGYTCRCTDGFTQPASCAGGACGCTEPPADGVGLPPAAPPPPVATRPARPPAPTPGVTSARPARPAPGATQSDALLFRVQVTLDAELEQLELESFRQTFVSEAAAALQVAADALTGVEIRGGSVVVSFQARLPSSTSASAVQERLASIAPAGYSVTSVDASPVAELVANEAGAAAPGCSWPEPIPCTVGSVSFTIVAVGATAAACLLLAVLCRLCTKKKAKPGPIADYAQWN